MNSTVKTVTLDGADPATANEEYLQSDHESGWVLPTAPDRQRVHTRSIICRGFKRADGLIDVEGRFIDTRAFAYSSEWRGQTPAGKALHHMQVRLTIDDQRVIRELVSAMPSTPHSGCPDVNANFQRIVGLSIAKGFKRELRERLGGIEGCTHVIGLLEAMAASALQTFTTTTYLPQADGTPKPKRVWKLDALVDTCYSYRNDGPMLAERRARSDS